MPGTKRTDAVWARHQRRRGPLFVGEWHCVVSSAGHGQHDTQPDRRNADPVRRASQFAGWRRRSASIEHPCPHLQFDGAIGGARDQAAAGRRRGEGDGAEVRHHRTTIDTITHLPRDPLAARSTNTCVPKERSRRRSWPRATDRGIGILRRSKACGGGILCAARSPAAADLRTREAPQWLRPLRPFLPMRSKRCSTRTNSGHAREFFMGTLMVTLRERSDTGIEMFEEMARPKKFELLTPKFVVWCSRQVGVPECKSVWAC